MSALFREEWNVLESGTPQPRRLRSLVTIRFQELKERVMSEDPSIITDVIRPMYAGDVMVVKDAYSLDFLKRVRADVFDWGEGSASSFHKMLEGVPDFHRIIDASISKNYSIETVRHTYYFFSWNGDPLDIFEAVYDKWRVIKFLGGFNADEYERNTPKDGVVDRIVIAHYPPGSGEQETHSDPFIYQRTIMGAKMSERGVDYHVGGIYFINQAGIEVDIEDHVTVGDIYLAYPTVLHGVKMVDPDTDTNWHDIRGRWFLGVYSAASDVVKERHTGYGVKAAEY